MTILDKVNTPADVKVLTKDELKVLAHDVRQAILNRDSKIGGHLGPNLGVVEMTIALHKVFHSPIDKFVWDVSHQSYPHKILTGRKNAYLEDDKFHEVTGFSTQHESEHDFFTVGHTSTSVANAHGLAMARDLQGNTGNVVAILGDGAFSGGLAMEGLNAAGDYRKNLIIILNDNEWAIAENHGGMYRHLAQLRESQGTAENNIFKSFGLDYRYLEQGNDIVSLVELFESVKDIDHPIVLHIHTLKGHGYEPAIKDPENMHQAWGPFDVETGRPTFDMPAGRTYNDVIHDVMDEHIAKGEPIIAINAAIPFVFDLKKFAKKYPERYIDGGIAEQFTVTFGGALALGGARPIIFHTASFLQRAFDQIVHDWGINKEPAVMIVRYGLIGGTDQTHQGSFAYAVTSNIPNVIDLAPTSEEDLKAMLEFALSQKEHPVIIHIPELGFENRANALTDYSKAKYQITKQGSKVAILGLGSMYSRGEALAEELEIDGIKATVINPSFVNLLDKETLRDLTQNHDVFVTIEDGTLDGGFGQKVASFLGQFDVKTLNFGADTEFIDSVPMDELYQRYHLTPELMAMDINEVLKTSKVSGGMFKRLFAK
ncbi:MAG: 1-deoxy-D-xylulose-5-phosphate synthase [Streptococcaceae bacterium]|jgi:1-deoxy-D-xylulose-5-phosphate synthase|nr:1-deoxy-D-xylulose-5-phosphate synthase [Streptococcaceae bacterium]